MATGTLAVGLRNMAKALFWCMISSMRTCIAVWRHFNDALLTGLLITTRTPHHRSRLRATESMSRADAANCPLPHAPSGRRNLFLTRFPPSSDLMKIKAATFFNDATKQRGKMSRRSPLRCCQVPGAEYIRLMAVSSPDLLRLIEKLECPRIAPIALERGETKKGVINGDGAAVWRRRLSQR